MSEANYNQVVQLAKQLTRSEQLALFEELQGMLFPAAGRPPLTLEALEAERRHLLAIGAFENVESMRNKYAKPDFDLSDEALEAGIHEFSTEWEKELDELF